MKQRKKRGKKDATVTSEKGCTQHVWERDYIDLSHECSMQVWSCNVCHDITTVLLPS